MSESSSNSTPYQHLLGAPVRILEAVKGELGFEWDEGIIACLFPTQTGVGIHVVHPETGVVTPGIGMDGVMLLPDTVKTIQATRKMMEAALAQMAQMFGDG